MTNVHNYPPAVTCLHCDRDQLPLVVFALRRVLPLHTADQSGRLCPGSGTVDYG